MSNYVNNYQTLSATGGKKNRFDLTHQVITTNDFGIQKPIALKYCVPGDSHKIDVRGFTRLMPMPSPTFGRIDTIVRAYFVPMRTIFPTFLEFVSMNPSPFGKYRQSVTSAPYFTLSDLTTVFTDPAFSTAVTSTDFDFVVSTTKYRFTLHGKRIYDMLISLGCNVNLGQTNDYNISLLPILAYYRSYFDWVVPARFLSDYRHILGQIRQLTNPRGYYHISVDDLKYLFKETRCFLEDDFFTSAWELPFSNGTSQSPLKINVPNPSRIFDGQTTPVSAHTNPSSSQPQGAHAEGNVNFNQYTLMSLGALQDMLNRGILAGTKVSDWLETEFGIKPNNKNIDSSLYLGKFSDIIQIGDVMATADTHVTPTVGMTSSDGAYLGQYAGKGLGSHNGKFEFNCDEHGYIVITSEILPRTSYYQGLHPEFSQLDRFDFFQPEFDNFAGEAIPVKLLCNSRAVNERDESFSLVAKPDDIFGFCPRYASLKTSFDTISGDFRCLSRNAGLESWFLARDFKLTSNYGQENYVKISQDFCDASNGTKTNSYDRIFQYTNNEFDHFFQIYVLFWFAERPMKSVSEFLKPQHEDNGKPITVNPNH